MCEYNKIEYSCGHWHGQAAIWCPTYTRTHRRCPPQFTHYEYRGWEVCCMFKPHQQPLHAALYFPIWAGSM
ncbi:hypothetical protein BD289DRAFT_294737 [Coniella lustricola]|uniref:Uncharacterized protein n=1 Tax=Coniella lustricola TaxID=2025994 RepID=A0A2T3A4X9_9PEZI|nr:hypothetical protein BD289DRAFT_294737 [Coniella lustricola]